MLRERKTLTWEEKHWSVSYLLYASSLGIRPATQVCPDWESNWQPFRARDDAPPSGPLWQGGFHGFLKCFLSFRMKFNHDLSWTTMRTLMSDDKIWLGGTVLVHSLQMYFCLRTTKYILISNTFRKQSTKKLSISIMGIV